MTVSREKDLTWRYSAILFVYWMIYAVLSAFASFYLLDAGFSNTMIGLLAALTGLVASVVQPLLAAYADRPESPSLRKLIALMSTLIAVLGVGVILTRGVSPVLCCVFYGCALVTLFSTLPLANALGVEPLNQHKPIKYGLSRAGGSAGYAVMAYGMGLLAAFAGAPAIPVTTVLCGGLLAILAWCYPLEKAKDVQPKVQDDIKHEGSFFRRYPKYMLLLLGCTFVYFSHSMLNNYALQIVRTRGGDSPEMGFATALAAIAELIPMLFYSKLVKKVHCHRMLILSGVFFALKNLGTLLSRSIAVYYAAQLMQLLAWGLMTLFLVLYVNRIMRRGDVVKGQAFATTSYTLGAAMGSLIGGWLLDSAGVDAMLRCGLIVALIGAVIISFGVEKVPVGEVTVSQED